jgi:hypothetical protein
VSDGIYFKFNFVMSIFLSNLPYDISYDVLETREEKYTVLLAVVIQT